MEEQREELWLKRKASSIPMGVMAAKGRRHVFQWGVMTRLPVGLTLVGEGGNGV